MRTEESLVAEFQELAGAVVADYTLKYKQALEQDPTLSGENFFETISKEFREKLGGVATSMLQKSVQPDLDLVFCFKKITAETTETFKAAILRGDLSPITVPSC
jgi:hypothetical protein